MNGRDYEFFDVENKEWTSAYLKPIRESSTMLSYAKLANKPVLGPWIKGWTHTSNDVIAKQSSCPDNMGRRGFKAFGHLRAGIRVQLTNLLASLCEPILSISSDHVACLLLQAIYEAGPMSYVSNTDEGEEGDVFISPAKIKKEGDVPSGGQGSDIALSIKDYREAHRILIDESFAQELIAALQDCIERLKSAGEQSIAIFTLASLTCRLFSLSDSESVRSLCLGTLSQLRDLAKQAWEALAVKGLEGGEDAQAALRDRVLAMLLACSATYDVEDEALKDVLQGTEALETLIHCSASIRKYYTNGAPRTFLTTLQIRRWQRLSHRSLGFVLEGAAKHPEILSRIVSCFCQGFQEHDTWKAGNSPKQAHILQLTGSPDGNNSVRLKVTFNLLSGELLLGAHPFTCLPPSIISHRNYKRLLGSWDAQVRPSELPGFTHRTFATSFGCILHFALIDLGSNVPPDLRILAVRQHDGRCFQYIPPSSFEGGIPSNFIASYFHWYDKGASILEFRPRTHRWTSSDNIWKAKRQDENPDEWELSQGESGDKLLLNASKSPVNILARQVESIARSTDICICLDKGAKQVSISLSRLGLCFDFDATTSMLHSKEFKGMRIDPDQSLGSLVGLQQKLVLCSASSTARGIIIPVGDVSVRPQSLQPTAHSQTLISKFADDRFSQQRLFYTIDRIKGEIVDDGSHMGKILLTLLHAMTSHFLPDPLTGYTGTEKALSILRSGAMASAQALTEPEARMLDKISKLSPIRIKEPKAQTVAWVPWLHPLAQHDWFATTAHMLLMLDKKRKALGSDGDLPEEDIPGDNETKRDMVARANNRLAVFRLDGFGGPRDVFKSFSTYKSRGEGWTKGGCHREKEVYATTEYIRKKIEGRLPHYNYEQAEVLEALNSVLGSEVDGLSSNPWPADLKFDPKWLQPPSKSVGRSFCHIHDVLSSGNQNFSDYHMIIFVSSLIFAQNPVPELIHIIRSFITSSSLRNLKPPPQLLFHPRLHKDSIFRANALRLLVTEKEMPRHIAGPLAAWRSKLEKMKQQFLDKLFEEPVMKPSMGPQRDWRGYIKVTESLKATRHLRTVWCESNEFRKYLEKIVEAVHELSEEPQLKGRAYDFSDYNMKTKAEKTSKALAALQLFTENPPRLSGLVPSTFQLETSAGDTDSFQTLSIDTSSHWDELLGELDKKIQQGSRGAEQFALD
ncbi:hypothetical protein MCOR03_011055 [Pyricularia oryzae]|nr:hypothetical protein MCOR01_006736 [Pyricularia oryzae]KAI6287381.1 hypothetical protein MCOR26_000633 [Pyricularia oryzae]KAI6349878.1 hypothetical protein MCOR28_000659 [Pyricularia oryzae]KAI6415531.1 hypothetical protein MCOR20_001514 [Pyricularia oryzae]KAI6547860.1 hypothetical protein MCOR03_011055 [Pyricularia oryzae]